MGRLPASLTVHEVYRTTSSKIINTGAAQVALRGPSAPVKATVVFGCGSRSAEIRRVRLNEQVANVHFHVLVYKVPTKYLGFSP